MARYIDAERMPNDSFWQGLSDKEKAKVLQWLLQSPTADVVEVKHGEWIDVYISSPSSFVGTCSMCRATNDIPPPTLANYCPNCGAKMDRGKTE